MTAATSKWYMSMSYSVPIEDSSLIPAQELDEALGADDDEKLINIYKTRTDKSFMTFPDAESMYAGSPQKLHFSTPPINVHKFMSFVKDRFNVVEART